jgi:hypothetical protein
LKTHMRCFTAKNADMADSIRSWCRWWECLYYHKKPTQQIDAAGASATCKMKRRVSDLLDEVKDKVKIRIFEIICASLTWSAGCHARCEYRLRVVVLIMGVSGAPTAATPFTTLLHWLTWVSIM